MKLAASDNVLEISGIDNQKAFSIKASGKAFRILSSSLYSNKIAAVVRELSCNAADSHIAAGKKDVPIEMHLPTNLEPWFSVKDYGTGLVHDDVITLYSTYFESTKNQSNDFVGAFGLGSKSPFAYTDTFTITSIFNGKKRFYTAYINENDIPNISLLNHMDTDEPNGIEVQVPVKNYDFSEFNRMVFKYLRHFTTLPKINIADYDWKLETPVFQGDDWKYYGSSNHQTPFTCIQGGVPYAITNMTGLSENVRKLDKLGIYLTFNIGDLDIAASREELSYNNQTRINLNKQCDKVYAELEAAFKEFIKDIHGSEWERQCAIKDFKRNNWSLYSLFDPDDNLIKDFKLEFSKFLTCQIEYRWASSRKNLQFQLQKARGGTTIPEEEPVITYVAKKNIVVFVNDKQRPYTWHKNYLTEQSKSLNDCDIAIITPGNENLQAILDTLGNPPIVYTSQLSKPETVKRIKRIDIRYLDVARSYITYSNTAPFPATGALYIDIDNRTFLRDGNKIKSDNLCNIIEKARQCEFFIGHDKIFILSKSEKAKIKDIDQHINVFDFLKDKLDVWFATNKGEYFKSLSYNNFSSHLNYSERSVLNEMRKSQDLVKTKGTMFYDLINSLNDYSLIKVDEDIIKLCELFGFIPDQTGLVINNLKELRIQCHQRYALMQCAISGMGYAYNEHAALFDYIMMIENQLTLKN